MWRVARRRGARADPMLSTAIAGLIGAVIAISSDYRFKMEVAAANQLKRRSTLDVSRLAWSPSRRFSLAQLVSSFSSPII